MDALMTVSGRFTGYREGLNQADIDFQGLIDKKGDQWLVKTIRLPSDLILRPPLSIAHGRFIWDKNGRTAFSGDLTIHNDLNLSADVLLEPHTINVKKFVIKDKVSHLDQHLKLNGEVNYSSKGIKFDTDLYSSGITLDNLVAALGKNKKNDHDVQKKTFWEFPAEGALDGLAIGIVFNGALSLTDKKINLTALVALLKTVDSFVKRIPVVGHTLGGSLTSIPISLKGDIGNPDIRILPPAAVGEGLVGIAERTLKLPVKIFDSFKPEKKD